MWLGSPMAKKKRKGEKEETYEWVPPEFDEKAFLEKDIVVTKSMMITAVLAVVFGALAFLVGSAAGNLVGFVAYIIGAVIVVRALPLLPVFKIKKEDIDKKALAGNVALYVLLALGVWILLMNPPFSP